MTSRSILVVMALLAAVSWPGHAIAQAPESEDAPLLSGPDIDELAERTLIARSADGRVVLLDITPEEAALNLLVLPPDVRERARQVFAERRQRLGAFLVAHVDVVRDITDAMQTGDRKEAERLSRTLYDVDAAEHHHDALIESLSDILPEPRMNELQELVRSYWTAHIDWELRRSPKAGADDRDEVRRRLAYRMYQQELRAAYEWALAPYRRKLEAIYELTEADEAQRAAIREAMIDFIRDSRLQPSADQRKALTRRIYATLDEAQRIELIQAALFRF